VTALSTLELELFFYGMLELDLFQWRGMVSKNLSMDMDGSVDGQVVEI